MGTEKHSGAAGQTVELAMINGAESKFGQTSALNAVVDNIAQTVQCAVSLKFLFGLAYCGQDAETETGIVVYAYSHR